MHPGAAEVCDGVDNDCNNSVDENANDAKPWFADADDDGYGDGEDAVEACAAPEGYVGNDDDCAPSEAQHWSDCGTCTDNDGDDYGVNCDLGADCDDSTETGSACHRDCTDYFADTDVDGHGDSTARLVACAQPSGYVLDATDCAASDSDHWSDCGNCADNDDDGHGTGCDLGADCDDSIATGSTCFSGCNTYYDDSDDDNYGTLLAARQACSMPNGYVQDNTDCSPGDAAHWADCSHCVDLDGDDWGANCDLGSDCDDTVATGTGCHTSCSVFFQDADNDAVGNAGAAVDACAQPTGFVSSSGDCDDEVTTGTNCSTGCTSFYADADADAHGDPAVLRLACVMPADFVVDNSDCAPASPVHWADCGLCLDADGDGFGIDCDMGLDCDDDAETGASCNTGCINFYADTDMDGHGDAQVSLSRCEAPVGFVDNNDDCDDNNATVYTGAPELCDGVDNDCDGAESELIVDLEGSGEYTSIQAGIDAVGTDTRVCVLPGRYEEHINFNGALIAVESSAGAPTTLIAGVSVGTPVVRFNHNEDHRALLKGFTIREGDVSDYYLGAGVHIENASPTLSDLIVRENSAAYGAGISIYNQSNPHLDRVRIEDNEARSFGGGLFVGTVSSAVLTDCHIANNDASTGAGGGIYIQDAGSQVSLRHVSILSNFAYNGGGGIWTRGDLVLDNCQVIGNTTRLTNNNLYGGGVYIDSGATVMTNVVVADNTSYNAGGGVCLSQMGTVPLSLTMTNVILAGNRVVNGVGGGLYSYRGDAFLTNVSIVGNSAEYVTQQGQGGGIYVSSDSTVELVNVDISHNDAEIQGGGIAVNGKSNSVLVAEHSNVFANSNENYIDIWGGAATHTRVAMRLAT